MEATKLSFSRWIDNERTKTGAGQGSGEGGLDRRGTEGF